MLPYQALTGRDIPHPPPSPARRPGAGQPRPARPALAGGSAFPARSGSRAGSSPAPRWPGCPPGLRSGDRSRSDARRAALWRALAASGSLDGGEEELLLSIPRRRSSSATRNSSRRITSARRACPASSAAISVSLAPPPPAAGHWPHAARPPHPGGQMDHLAQATTDHNTQYVIKSTRRADSTHSNLTATAKLPPLNGHATRARARSLTSADLLAFRRPAIVSQNRGKPREKPTAPMSGCPTKGSKNNTEATARFTGVGCRTASTQRRLPEPFAPLTLTECNIRVTCVQQSGHR